MEIDRNSIHYIGKESNELERSESLGVFPEDTIQYVNFQAKIREIVKKLTLEKALEIGMSRREFYYLKKKLESDKPIILKKKLSRIILRTLRYLSKSNLSDILRINR